MSPACGATSAHGGPSGIAPSANDARARYVLNFSAKTTRVGGVPGAGNRGSADRHVRSVAHADSGIRTLDSLIPQSFRLLRKPSERDEQIEARLTDAILGDGRGRVGVAGPPLRVDELDVGRGAGAKRQVGDLQHFGGVLGTEPRVDHRALGALDRRLRVSQLGARLQLELR